MTLLQPVTLGRRPGGLLLGPQATGFLALALVVCVLSPRVRAAADNWTATAAGSSWGTAGNWSAGVPISTSAVTFNATTGLDVSVPLIPSATAASLTFSAAGGTTNAYTFDAVGTENAHTLALSGGITNANTVTATQTFYNAFTLSGSQTWTATSGAMDFFGNVNLGSGATGYTLTVKGKAQLAELKEYWDYLNQTLDTIGQRHAESDRDQPERQCLPARGKRL